MPPEEGPGHPDSGLKFSFGSWENETNGKYLEDRLESKLEIAVDGTESTVGTKENKLLY